MLARLLLLGTSWSLIGILIGACQPNPTVFRGSAQFPGGPSACHARCASDGLEMSGFVYSGEFASSCVCRPRSESSSPAVSPSSAPVPAAAAQEAATDPLADRGPGDASGTDLDSAAESAGAQVPIEAAAAAAAAAGARTQQQQILQHRKP